jgi:hypothetical protein
MRPTGVAWLAAVAVAGAAPAVRAQQPVAVRVSSENDAFLFWRPPWERTDHEYTSGARGSLHYPGRSRLLPVDRIRRVCGGDACRSHSYALGQEIYTGEPPATAGVEPAEHPSRRTNAAWLYVEAAERDSTGRDVTDITLRVGVVGPPALGKPMQEFFHVIGPEYPLPVDWSTQLPFEPGFVATVARSRRVAAWPQAERVGASLAAHGSASVGTIRTGASAGVRADVIVALRPAQGGARWPRVAAALDVTGHGVLRDEFLDGTFFRSSPSLPKHPAYGQGRATLELRWSRVSLGYAVVRTGPQYDGQGAPTTWGTLMAEWRPAR